MRISLLLAICALTLRAAFAAQAYSGLSPEEAVKAFKLPDGFHIALVAAEPDVVQPVAFDFDDRGRLWVAQFLSYPKWAAEGHDSIILLEDTKGAGRMDRRSVIWEKGNYVTSFTLGYGGIWVTSPPNLLFIPCDFNADKPVAGEPKIVLDGWSHAGTHNIVSNLTWGPDGWLYGGNGISSRSRVGPPGTPESARVFIDGGIWRYHPVTKKLEQVCTGMTNPWGLDWDTHGELFCTNNVTAHLFHVVPGARFERSHESDQNPYTYELMGGVADHKHYAGANWADIKKPGPHADFGGGHSHVGCMIYKGADWPARYRDTVFMCNTHGNRINNDKLELTPNGYVAHHGEDFALSNDKSFRGVTLKMGPDGAMYVSDWHQDGECHSGTEVGSGRVFRIWYGEKPLDVQLAVQSLQQAKNSYVGVPGAQLASGLTRDNGWIEAHLYRMWSERQNYDADDPPKLKTAIETIDSEILNNKRFQDGFVKDYMDVKDPLFRVHRYSLILTSPWPAQIKRIASGAMARNPTDAENRNNRLFLWYVIEPLCEGDPTWAFQVFRETKIPALRPFIARRMSEHKLPLVVEELAKTTDEALQLDLLKGMAAALKGRFKLDAPPGWKEWYSKQKPETENQKPDSKFALAQQIAAVFGDVVSLDALRKIAEDKKSERIPRQNALQSLIDAHDSQLVPTLQKLVKDLDMRRDALRALARFDDPETAPLILKLYPTFEPAERNDALATLAARPATAQALLAELKSKRVPGSDLNAATVRALEAHGIAELDAWIKENWGASRPTAENLRTEIARLKKLVTESAPNTTDVARGKEVFKKTCFNCHTLFGEGGKVGPDLTGSGRANLDYILLNVVDPNAIVPQEYFAWTVKTTDGRVLSGLVRNETEHGFDVVTATETVMLRNEDVKSRKRGTLSMMPEGVLSTLKDNEILDLISYLQSNTGK